MIIGLVEYAKRQGRNPDVVRLACLQGRFKTAVKFGSQWGIDENEPWPEDKRYKDGKHVDWRKRYPPRQKVEPEAPEDPVTTGEEQNTSEETAE